MVFATGDSCQDWAKRLAQSLNLPRKAEDVFSLAFYAWGRDSEENNPKPLSLSSSTPGALVNLPWWLRTSARDQPLTGEKLFRFEVIISYKVARLLYFTSSKHVYLVNTNLCDLKKIKMLM